MVDGGIQNNYDEYSSVWQDPKVHTFQSKKKAVTHFFLDPWRLLDSGFLESMCSENVVTMFHLKHEVFLSNSMLGKSVNWTFFVCCFLLCNMIYIKTTGTK